MNRGTVKKRLGERAKGLRALQPALLLSWWRTWRTLPVLSWILGAESFKRGDYRSGVEHYRRGLETHPQHRAVNCARLDYAYCLYQLNQLPEAITQLKLATAQEPSLKDAHLLLAKLQLFTGQAFVAARTLRRAAENFREDPQVALAYAHAVIAARGPSAQVHDARERLHELRAQTDLADPLQSAIEAALACFEFRFGDVEVADHLLARVIAGGGAPFEVFLVKGEKQLEEGRIVPARDQFERAMRLVPQDPRPLALLAKTYLAPGDSYEPEYALQLAQLACERSHYENPEMLLILAEAYETVEDPSNALLISTRMKALTSTRQINFDYLQRVEEQLQRLRQAKLSVR